jgi:hypothetical protein
MRPGVLWTVLMLGLPQVAAAGATGATVPPVLPGAEAGIERAETSAKATRPALDLRIDDPLSGAVPPVVPGGALALEHPETLGEAAPSELDSWSNPAQLPSAADRSEGTRPSGGGEAGPDGEPSVADRGLSFGFEVKPRNSMGALARQHEAEDPGLGGQLERLIERPSFGLRGRYRF